VRTLEIEELIRVFAMFFPDSFQHKVWLMDSCEAVSCNHPRCCVLCPGAVKAAGNKLVYHRLDLLPTESNCMYFRQLATFSETCLSGF